MKPAVIQVSKLCLLQIFKGNNFNQEFLVTVRFQMQPVFTAVKTKSSLPLS